MTMKTLISPISNVIRGCNYWDLGLEGLGLVLGLGMWHSIYRVLQGGSNYLTCRADERYSFTHSIYSMIEWLIQKITI